MARRNGEGGFDQVAFITFLIRSGRLLGSGRLLSHRAEAGKVGLLWSCAHAPSLTGCPIEAEELVELEAVPEDAADKGEEAGEAMGPFAEEGLEAEQDVEQERGPDLPADGIGAVTEEVAELEGLLDLLEEDLDLPAAAVEVGDGGRSPVKVVG